jgi:GTP-binding protein
MQIYNFIICCATSSTLEFINQNLIIYLMLLKSLMIRIKPLHRIKYFCTQIKFMSSIVAIVGRPNVGKSTFFNRMIQKREAIVDAVSGVTRDRHYGKSDWNGRVFTLIDTGGYVERSDDIFQKEIDKQVNLAIDEADAIIFMVDATDGVTGMDETMAQLLRRAQKPIFLAT